MGKRGPAPTPKELKIARGTLRPCREVKDSVLAKGKLPTKPRDLSLAAKKHWDQIIKLVKDWNVLTPADGIALKMLCQSLVRYDRLLKSVMADGESFQVIGKEGEIRWVKNPDAGTLREVETFARGMLREFGITPSARSRVGAISDEKKAENDRKKSDREMFFA